jgi:hypothetical protein
MAQLSNAHGIVRLPLIRSTATQLSSSESDLRDPSTRGSAGVVAAWSA